MTKPPTLNGLKQLKESGFGKCYPRHGLKLLYWFANDCLYFDDNNKMRRQYDPEEGDFGFHFFKNKNEINGDTLLPHVKLDYYEVGNLREAEDLPDYVREDYTQNCEHPDSNKDRIIVSIKNKCFDRVYVTEHSDRRNFNKKATYCISRGLIITIRRLSLEKFLSKSGYLTLQENSYQGIVDLKLQEDNDLNIECSRPVKDSVQSSKEEDGYDIWNDIEYENRCGCIVL